MNIDRFSDANDRAQRIKSQIKKGEGLSVEFKESRQALNRDIYETVCAFLNRHGGTLLLGVKDNGTVIGVDPKYAEQLKKDFVNTLNNPEKSIRQPICPLRN